MTTADHSSQILSELTECAYRLGLAFGAEAEREPMSARGLEYFQLFDRCFFSVRVAIGLTLRLQREQPTLRSMPEREELRERADAPDRDRVRDVRERERDREVERPSMPLLLKTLEGVVADASALPGPQSGALLSLRELLAQITKVPTTPAKPTHGLRARLTASATAPSLTFPLRNRPGSGLPGPHATGPPRR